MAAFGSDDWADALKREINDSSEYRNAAAKWGVDFNGNMLFVFEPDEEAPERRALMLKLSGGKCQDASFIDVDSHPDAGFVLRGPFQLWREILQRKTMAATAILTGKMQVVGERMQLLKHTAANRALIHCTASVDTGWER
jgi:putative sterol carrier protein